MDALIMMLAAVVLAAISWFAYRSEPHWVAKDGKAFTCRVQRLSLQGGAEGHWAEGRAYIDGSRVVVLPRGYMSSRHLPGGRRGTSFRVLRRSESAPRNKAYFLVDAGETGHELSILRVPATSRAVPHIEALAQH